MDVDTEQQTLTERAGITGSRFDLCGEGGKKRWQRMVLRLNLQESSGSFKLSRIRNWEAGPRMSPPHTPPSTLPQFCSN